MNYSRTALATLFSTVLLVPTVVFAQTENPDDPATTTEDGEPIERRGTIGRGAPTERLPAPRSDDDPNPPVAAPKGPVVGVVRQAGVGGTTAYGRAGVLELGGSASFASATDFTQLTLNPSVGWFFMDNVQGSLIFGLSHISADNVDTTFLSLLVEPSLHIPFTETVFGFLGAGIGPSWADGPGLGFAFAPRVGMNVVVGRSGVLSPSVFVQYSTHEAIATPSGTLLAVNLTFGAGVGYTVMW